MKTLTSAVPKINFPVDFYKILNDSQWSKMILVQMYSTSVIFQVNIFIQFIAYQRWQFFIFFSVTNSEYKQETHGLHHSSEKLCKALTIQLEKKISSIPF